MHHPESNKLNVKKLIEKFKLQSADFSFRGREETLSRRESKESSKFFCNNDDDDDDDGDDDSDDDADNNDDDVDNNDPINANTTESKLNKRVLST